MPDNLLRSLSIEIPPVGQKVICGKGPEIASNIAIPTTVTA